MQSAANVIILSHIAANATEYTCVYRPLPPQSQQLTGAVLQADAVGPDLLHRDGK